MENNKINHYLIDLKELGDIRGGLVAIEEMSDFPFHIKRVFYEYNTNKDISRGNHANIDSRFGFISIVGSCSILVNDGYKETKYVLDSPRKLLVVDKMIWKTMKDFTNDNILLVLSDQKYNPKEYIRDFEEFRLKVQGGRIL